MDQPGPGLFRRCRQFVLEGFIGGNAPCQYDFFQSRGLDGQQAFLHQHIRHRFLEGGRHIGFIHRPPGLLLIVQVIDHRRFHSAEAELERIVQHGPWKINGFRVAFQGQFLDFRTAGIRHPHDPGNFVKGFPRRVVPGLPQHFKAVIPCYLKQGRVTPGYHQSQKRRLQIFVIQEIGKHMAFQMIDPDQRLARGPG